MRVNKAQLLAAAGAPLGNTGTFTYGNLVSILNNLVTYALQWGGVLAIAMIIYYGLKMATARDDAAAFGKAKDMLIMAAVGLLLIAGAYVIIYTIQDAVGGLKQ